MFGVDGILTLVSCFVVWCGSDGHLVVGIGLGSWSHVRIAAGIGLHVSDVCSSRFVGYVVGDCEYYVREFGYYGPWSRHWVLEFGSVHSD